MAHPVLKALAVIVPSVGAVGTLGAYHYLSGASTQENGQEQSQSCCSETCSKTCSEPCKAGCTCNNQDGKCCDCCSPCPSSKK
ncbi:hypothetical protein MHLP_03650 [Candidatus Mycoplasma haematolamae str. Purdue]|uniref:Uncharacterized protein n=1 Tax=Mycoplasma haematolamae (strain Purdue) TaxID=1212765 RepID=I7BAI0_MYCHA|nr:hypothetical protein [Candidatus Mycoplasma haematolamae]AFO52310.1 hypothetical protein MHLP_03650 [Candidatus Mycoplasma haematolamae str. Purdue]